jgi:acetolactate synthase-1/2/3 large subunit
VKGVNGAKLLIEALVREEVRYIFSVSGSSILSLYDACFDAPIDVVHARHEWGASFMAEGWGRVTGRPGVCLVTLGPGVANATNAALTARLAGVPVVILGGRAPTRVWDRDGFGDIDTAALMRPVTKFSRTLTDPSRIPEYVHLAFHQACSGRPGPVYLEIPQDVLEQDVREPTPKAEPLPVSRPAGDASNVRTAASRLAAAERPVVIAGSGTRLAGAGTTLADLAERVGAPVFCARLARGLLPKDHPYNLGIAAISLNPTLRQAMREADLLLVAGARLDWDLDFGSSDFFRSDLKIIQIDINPEQIGWPRMVEVGIAGDAELVLRQFVSLTQQGPRNDNQRARWVDALRRHRDEFTRALSVQGLTDESPVHPARLCQVLSETIEPDATIALGGGEIWSWGRQYLDTSPPGGILEPHQSGTLGAEIPYAIAAKLARPSTQVVALTGDGGFGYSGIELDTARRYGVAITCIIANDSAWAMEKWSQIYAYGKERIYATGLQPVNYAQLAAALNLHSERVEHPAALPQAVRRALASDQTACVEVITRDLPGPDTRWWFVESRQGSPG